MGEHIVKSSSAWVASHASHVSINSTGIERLVEQFEESIPTVQWDFEGIHYNDNGPLTAQYLLVLDALNFCFWPDEEFQYDDLALGLKRALMEDKMTFDAARLKNITGIELRKLLQWPRELPLEDERARLLREVGMGLELSFSGQAANLVSAANGSAVALVELLACHFPGFRDHYVYKGHQIFLYKRAQIFVADLWGAFQGQGLGAFQDIASLTMFADYVVPAVLRHMEILSYGPFLSTIVDECKELPSGTEEEVEIRACAVTAVEKLRELIRVKFGKQILSVHLDWWLWSSGKRSNKILPCHRTRTIYY